MRDFLSSIHCKSRSACSTCRLVPEWRRGMGAPDECPYGVTATTIPPLNPQAYADEASGIGPSLVQRAMNFAASAAKHVASGLPMASEEEIERRFAICQQCEHYDGKSCAKCGCPVKRERQYLSKLSWSDQSCPVGKWGPNA